jgi:hypothetical protein
MEDETGALLPRTLFVGLSTPEFNGQVQKIASLYFDIVDKVPPTGSFGGLLLRGPGVIPHAVVIVAFSPKHGSELPPAKTIDEVVTAFPESEYYFVFPDDQPQDPLEPFIDKVLNGRVPGRGVMTLRNFTSALEVRYIELTARSPGIASGEAFGEGGEIINDEIIVTFDPSLSAEQIEFALTALADYYRACGGVGLPADDFESEEAIVLEDAHV